MQLLETGMIVTQENKPVSTLPSRIVKELFVYPNPAKDILNIVWNGDIQSIRVLSINGLAIKIEGESIADKQLNIGSWSPGVYILWVESAGEWYPARFIKL